jgi:tripartite-type tricarboxylate transporter receptor subunit TctC
VGSGVTAWHSVRRLVRIAGLMPVAGLLGVSLLGAGLPGATTLAQTPEGFFRGRQITFLIGAGAGGGYDAYFRTFARYVVHHIPGAPSIVPKNMPAASGLAAANTLYTSADRDGATIGAFPNNIPMDPLFGNPGARYDPQKLNWLGSIGKLENVCATWITSPIKTIAQAREREVIVAAAAATSNSAIMPKVLNALLGTRFKIVAGYDPGSGMTLALESGETEGVCGLSWSTIKAARPHWIKDNKLNVLVQLGLAKLPELPDVPAALDLVTDPVKRQVLELILIRQEIGRPVAAPPGVPAERLETLRRAFDATMKDPEFLAEAEKLQLEIEPLSAQEIDGLLANAFASPKAIVQQAAELIEPSVQK